MQNACMTIYTDTVPVNITIRNVPDRVRDELAARAESAGQSMQEYLVRELTELVERPRMADVLNRVRAHSKTLRPISVQEIVDGVRASRGE